MIWTYLKAVIVTACVLLCVIACAQTLASRPSAVFRDCPQCPQMVVVPKGSFTMGSPSSEAGRGDDEGPQHRVAIGRPFAVSKFEVMRGEFGEFVRESGYDAGNECFVWAGSRVERQHGKNWADPGYRQSDAHPAACVSWNDAKAYADWLSRKTGQTYRLLSEAEWEYAARAGTETKYSFGDRESDLCRHGNGPDLTTKESGGPTTWDYAECQDGFGLTAAPVGSFGANRFGLHDMHGNVWEWVEDGYQDNYHGVPLDGSAWIPADSQYRVYRGGHYAFAPRVLRSASRYRNSPDSRSSALGFRVARTL